jgi:hypothetical protein
MAKEADRKPIDPSPLQEYKLSQNITQSIFNYQDLPLMDYNTYDTDNFHHEAKPNTTKRLPQEHQPSDQSFEYLIQTPPATIGSSLSCNIYQSNYPSRNKLFRYIREAKYHRRRIPSVPESDESTTSIPTPEVIKSNSFGYIIQSLSKTNHLPQESKSSDQSLGYIKVNSISTIGSPLSFYDICQAVYASQNKLFRHIREVKYHGKLPFSSITLESIISHSQYSLNRFLHYHPLFL